MINESLKSGVFSSELKLQGLFQSSSQVILLYSIIRDLYLYCLSFQKKFEKIDCNIVFNFLYKNKVLYDYQF